MKDIDKKINYEEKELKAASGWGVLFLTIILYLAALAAVIICAMNTSEYDFTGYDAGLIVGIVWLCICWTYLTEHRDNRYFDKQ